MPINEEKFKERWKSAWGDPVWSKVIAGGILSICGLIGILIKSIYDNMPFGKVFKALFSFMSTGWTIPVWLILLLIFAYIFFTWTAFEKFLIDVRNSRKELKEEAEELTEILIMVDYQGELTYTLSVATYDMYCSLINGFVPAEQMLPNNIVL